MSPVNDRKVLMVPVITCFLWDGDPTPHPLAPLPSCAFNSFSSRVIINRAALKPLFKGKKALTWHKYKRELLSLLTLAKELAQRVWLRHLGQEPSVDAQTSDPSPAHSPHSVDLHCNPPKPWGAGCLQLSSVTASNENTSPRWSL